MKRYLSLLFVTLLLNGTAFAAQEIDKDEAFDNAVRNFGYVSGLAHQCVQDDKKGEVERAVIKSYTGIVSLFGSDQAFFYAAAFGAGSTSSFDRKECKKHLEVFEQQLKKNTSKQ